MIVQAAEYVKKEGVSLLKLLIDGHPAYIYMPKYFFLQRGLVQLQTYQPPFDYWRNILAEVVIPADPENGQSEICLHGFTDDRIVVQLARDYYDAMNRRNGKVFVVGKIPIPLAREIAQ